MIKRSMRARVALAVLSAAAMVSSTVGAAPPPRPMEKLDRGVVALHHEQGKAFVSWRLLGTEPTDLGFNVYRSTAGAAPVKLNDAPLTGPTHFVDDKFDASKSNTYTVRAVVGGQEVAGAVAGGSGFTLPADAPVRAYLSIPMKSPGEGYRPGDSSVADLDGDGSYEIIVKMEKSARDNSQGGVTDPVFLQAYKLDGTMLWQINLGRNIRAGAHYTQFMVYDFDNDGRAELICKTADGTVDGKGKVIGDADANWVNQGGYIVRGPEFLTVFNGPDGAAVDTVKYAPARSESGTDNPDEIKRLWGDSYGNRFDRFLAGVAYLDGVTPSAVMCRGYYTRSTLAAWDYKGGKLSMRWLFDTGTDRTNPYYGQGHHSLSIADVTGDGRDEVIYGAAVISSDGKGLFSTGNGHGDAHHVSDHDPSNPGLEVFAIQERFSDAGAYMYDAATGRVLWKKPSVKAAESGGDRGEGPGRGIAADIDPRFPGSESWALGAGMNGIWDAKGNLIADRVPTFYLNPGEATFQAQATTQTGRRRTATCNFRIYWDGDRLSELLDRNQVLKWDWEKQETRPLLVAGGATSINGTKSNPAVSADLLGDWREEVVFPATDGTELRVYTTTIPTEYRTYTLMHDPVYRLAVAWQNVAYNQPPHVSWDFFGQPAPKPNITLVEPKTTVGEAK